jgi:hypothetical protein
MVSLLQGYNGSKRHFPAGLRLGKGVKMKKYHLGKIAGLEIIADRRAFVGTLFLWALLSAVGLWLLKLPLLQAVLGGLVAALLHWISEIVHNLGHAYAAWRTGYPMRGVRLGPLYLLGMSLYPQDEGELPAEVHIRRALGGPIASLLFALLLGLLAWLLGPGNVLWWISVFAFLDNFFVFTLGGFLPLGFTDGSTILYWQKKRKEI